jgi:hypothetical protein
MVFTRKWMGSIPMSQGMRLALDFQDKIKQESVKIEMRRILNFRNVP